MSFTSTYRLLEEVFPQVDKRLLRAIAVENPNNPDVAVEEVLNMGLPFISGEASVSPASATDDQVEQTEDSLVETPSADNLNSEPVLSGEEVVAEQKISLHHQGAAEQTKTCSPSEQGHSFDFEECMEMFRLQYRSQIQAAAQKRSSTVSAPAVESSDGTDAAEKELEKGFDGSAMNGDLNSDLNCTSEAEQELANKEINNTQIFVDNLDSRITEETLRQYFGQFGELPHVKIPVGKRCGFVQFDSRACAEEALEMLNGTALGRSTIRLSWGRSPNKQDQSGGMVPQHADSAANSEFSNSEFAKLESSGSLESSSERVFCDTENDIVENSSSATCSMDLLENAIEDAKNNKKTLFTAMETVINMMKEAELEEQKAELLKQEAPSGGIDTLERVEDLRQMLQRAREANDMHAGEVYGEKSILATEMRELQSRLINLSDERDASLSILDEMNQTLVARIAAAEEMRVAAEKEKQEREESARELLAEQELIMEKVVQESKRLQEEADENSKLRDFLMDRGRTVDILQGEIAVICKDVKLLKEKFDECVPFSKSLPSSQTSCILASSGSFSKSLIADWVPEHDPSSGTLKKITPASSSVSSVYEDHPLVNNTSPENKDTKFDGKKSLSDDDWDMMFDDETALSH